ncbi:MAG: thiopurine S-methyltransferase [Thiotrichaceae bacterium]|uniref:Thiopurine S-methyltransferase n=1 Tax=Candidatus Thiocaldithrix dubininis TaxID=3080823 RepID=A0AA95KK77_9GAMM|nr:MAG: thiopurine S-methyltransferase [Candidatus Thiocaldithrix dubininis]
MRARFWHERWQNKEIGFHQDEVNGHLQQFWSEIKAPKDAYVFVPLCGKSRDMLWLREQDYKVMGVELSPIAANEFFDESNLSPTVSVQPSFELWEDDNIAILVGDFFDLTPEQLQDCGSVYDRASLIALPPDMRERYAQHLTALLKPGIEVLLIALEYDQAQMAGPPFSVSEAEVHQLYDEHFHVELLHIVDALDDSPNFRKRGLTRLDEKVYRLTRR